MYGKSFVFTELCISKLFLTTKFFSLYTLFAIFHHRIPRKMYLEKWVGKLSGDFFAFLRLFPNFATKIHGFSLFVIFGLIFKWPFLHLLFWNE
jgi:hypothetical protein